MTSIKKLHTSIYISRRQSYHSAVKSTGVLVLWFRASMSFRLSSNTYAKRFFLITTWESNFFSCFFWLITGFWTQNIFCKNISCFQFWWKTCAKRCANNYVISRVKGIFSPAFCGWSRAFNFRIWFGKRKTFMSAKRLNYKYDGKNSDFDFVLLLFSFLTFSCLYCRCNLF